MTISKKTSAAPAAIKVAQKVLELFRDDPEQKLPKHKKPRSSTERFMHKAP